MAPVYESDLAEERFARSSWQNYELWEKVEVRLRRRRHAWIAGTIALFLTLSALPVVRERGPAWKARRATRDLALVLGQLKREAATEGGARRFRFVAGDRLDYVIEKLDDCGAEIGAPVREGRLLADADSGVRPLTADDAGRLGIPGVVDRFCYDAVRGTAAEPSSARAPGEAGGGMPPTGIAMIPVKDLAEGRVDRFSLLLVSGAGAEISFD